MAAAFGLPVSQVVAQGTAFTYQGRLNAQGVAANGSYDLTFALYDSLGGGNVVGLPVTNSAVSVSNGLFTLTLDFGSGVFPGANRWLEIGVRTNGSQAPFVTLNPRQQTTATPYAIQALGAAQAASVAAGSITGAGLAPGAASANLQASGQSGVASGGVVLSATDSTALASAGYVKIGTAALGEGWQQRVGGGTPPAAREYHQAVWTGSEMLVWGGDAGNIVVPDIGVYFGDGGRYNPAANTWTAITTNGAPSARTDLAAVWTGSEMIIWGGSFKTNILGDGGRYNPTTDTWTPVGTNGAPAARLGHTMVWTGSNMIVWGGYGGSYFNGGARYNPTSNTWTAISTTNAPSGRFYHTAIWTGGEMIVWGGSGLAGALNDGGRYNPASDTWAAVNAAGAPSARFSHTGLWTGSEMIVWGGVSSGGNFNDGGHYNPVGDSWTPVTTVGAPSPRYGHTAVWTGSEMIVWGGFASHGVLNDGGRFNPTAGTWTAVTTNSPPPARDYHTAVWTGNEMIIWGGQGLSSFLNDTWSYALDRTMFLYQKP